ncbi:MAG: hypothetical protein MUC69_07910 [Gemmatimonadales bacterium]|nr:hypothetical protein [Gemmatimonadales bacterium]
MRPSTSAGVFPLLPLQHLPAEVDLGHDRRGLALVPHHVEPRLALLLLRPERLESPQHLVAARPGLGELPRRRLGLAVGPGQALVQRRLLRQQLGDGRVGLQQGEVLGLQVQQLLEVRVHSVSWGAPATRWAA